MRQFCQECGAEMRCMVAFGADETLSGLTERLYLCDDCLSTWQVTELKDGGFEIERYFFG